MRFSEVVGDGGCVVRLEEEDNQSSWWMIAVASLSRLAKWLDARGIEECGKLLKLANKWGGRFLDL